MNKTLTLHDIIVTSKARCVQWHGPAGVMEWDPANWAVAMMGEAGEACNALKKLRRVEDEIANENEPGRQLTTRAAAIAQIGEELADTLLYLVLLAARLDIDLPEAVVYKFNKVSEKYGFPERLAGERQTEPMPKGPTHYYLRQGTSIYIKEASFFLQQGGAREAWGKNWCPLAYAASIGDARRKAAEIEGVVLSNLYHSEE